MQQHGASPRAKRQRRGGGLPLETSATEAGALAPEEEAPLAAARVERSLISETTDLEDPDLSKWLEFWPDAEGLRLPDPVMHFQQGGGQQQHFSGLPPPQQQQQQHGASIPLGDVFHLTAARAAQQAAPGASAAFAGDDAQQQYVGGQALGGGQHRGGVNALAPLAQQHPHEQQQPFGASPVAVVGFGHAQPQTASGHHAALGGYLADASHGGLLRASLTGADTLDPAAGPLLGLLPPGGPPARALSGVPSLAGGLTSYTQDLGGLPGLPSFATGAEGMHLQPHVSLLQPPKPDPGAHPHLSPARLA